MANDNKKEAALSAADLELQTNITKAVKAEDGAKEKLVERGKELGELLIRAFHRYPSQDGFKKFLKPTGFTYSRAVPLLFAAGGRREGEELQRQLALVAKRVSKHRDKNTKLAAPAPLHVAGNGADTVPEKPLSEESIADPRVEKPNPLLAGSAATEIRTEDRQAEMGRLAGETVEPPVEF